LAGYPQYFHPLACVRPGDVLCEGGIDNGKSTESFYEAMRGQGRIFAFEPVASSFEQSRELLRPYAQTVHLEHKALWSGTGVARLFVDPHYSGSSFVSEDMGNTVCDCVSIDDYFADRGSVSCIKLDVEGAELPVLQGALATMRRYRPRLAISIYHTLSDYVHISRWLRELDFGYRWYVGHHKAWFNETVLYGAAE
jgi:FkbM family methyltransferase